MVGHDVHGLKGLGGRAGGGGGGGGRTGRREMEMEWSSAYGRKGSCSDGGSVISKARGWGREGKGGMQMWVTHAT